MTNLEKYLFDCYMSCDDDTHYITFEVITEMSIKDFQLSTNEELIKWLLSEVEENE